MSTPVLRSIEDRDLTAIVAIYNDVLQTTSAIWNEQPTTVGQRRTWLAETRAGNYPALVAEDRSGVLGFVAAGPFRPWPGYSTTCEHSIHVRADARGRGVGAGLLTAMQEALRCRGTHVMVAGIDATNEGSLRFHVRAGFVEVARMPEVGLLNGSWRDLVLVQKTLHSGLDRAAFGLGGTAHGS